MPPPGDPPSEEPENEPDPDAAVAAYPDLDEEYYDGWSGWVLSGQYFPIELGPTFLGLLHDLNESLIDGEEMPIPPERLRIFMLLYPDQFDMEFADLAWTATEHSTYFAVIDTPAPQWRLHELD